MLRWGILGPGGIAARAIAPAMREAGHDLACVGSRSKTKAQSFAANHGVRRARGSYEEVITADDVDAVYISLPNNLHEPWTIAALEAGKHVLCEKPLSLDAAGAGRMAAASAEHGGVLMEAGMWWFHPRTAAAMQAVRSERIGQLRHINATFCYQMRNANDYRAQREHGGGALLDVGYYGVTAARWFSGSEPETIRALQRMWPSGVDTATTALLSFPRGQTATVHASFDASLQQTVELIGTEGVLRLPQAFNVKGVSVPLLIDDNPVDTFMADPYEEMITGFAEAVATGGPAPLSVDDSVATADVMDRIRAAASPAEG